MTNNQGRKILYTVLGFVAVIIVLVPFLWMILTSFKTPDDIFSIPARWLPKNPTFANYVSVWRDYPFKAYFANSLVVSLSTVLISDCKYPGCLWASPVQSAMHIDVGNADSINTDDSRRCSRDPHVPDSPGFWAL